MMKQVIILSAFIALLFTATYANVRGVDQYEPSDTTVRIPILKQLEQEDSLTGARVILANNTKVLFDRKEGGVVKGYRVKVFFDNSQSARASAERVKMEFSEKYPTVPVYIQYVAPYFNVMAGDFTAYQDALALLHNVVKDYSKSFIVNQTIPIKVFGKKEIIVVDSTSTETANPMENGEEI